VTILGLFMGMSPCTYEGQSRIPHRHPDDMLRLFSQKVVVLIDPLLDDAWSGSVYADEVLRLVAQHFITRGELLPERLADYVCKVLRREGPKLKQGRRTAGVRDHAIFTAVQQTRECGCSAQKAYSIVSIALGRLKNFMTEDALKKISTRRKLRPARSHPEAAEIRQLLWGVRL
jgi:hypothetical protein